MNIANFIELIKKVEWDKYKDILYYKPENVAKSLIALALVDKESTERIHVIKGTEPSYLMNAIILSDVLFSIGNDHRGTYYLLVTDALPFIIEVALDGNHIVARNCAISILIDLYCFCPEPDSEELSNFVQNTIKSMIEQHHDNFTAFAKTEKRNKSLIEWLFSLVKE